MGSPITDYTDTFSGTSAAAPQVSGVAALMLAANPALTWRDVKHILARTAVRVNPSDSTWTTGPLRHSEKYGFGLVDAGAAVNLASSWVSVPPERGLEFPRLFVPMAIPDSPRAGLSDTAAVGSEHADFTVEHVEVIFDAIHDFRRDLEITLTSPAATVSHLAPSRFELQGDFSGYRYWRFGSVRHWGESAAGTWTLRVTDKFTDLFYPGRGTWNGWVLRLYGTTLPKLAVESAATVDFGEVGVGGATDRRFTVRNAGQGNLAVRVASGSPQTFSIVSAAALILAAGTSQEVVVRFSPNAAGTFASAVTLASEFGSTSKDLTGTAFMPVRLTVDRAGNGAGRVVSTPAAIDCTARCEALVRPQASITLTARSVPGSRFLGWTGCDTADGSTCTLTMNDHRSVSANFTVLRRLTVRNAVGGRGRVQSNIAGIDCGRDCREDYPSGTLVTLTATPHPGTVFDGWTGACSGQGPCTLSLDVPRYVTATFTRIYNVSLIVSRVGTGSGTITSQPLGVACSPDCTEAYPLRTEVTLTATPAVGSDFSGWQGCDSVSGTTCTVRMTKRKFVTAAFAKR